MYKTVLWYDNTYVRYYCCMEKSRFIMMNILLFCDGNANTNLEGPYDIHFLMFISQP